MTTSLQLLYWSPRVLCLLFAAFLAVFAADVFGESRSAGETAAALLMHLIPSFLILLVLAVSWKREWIGSVVFTALGILYVVSTWGRFPWSVYLMIAGPLFLLGILFLANWRRRSELRPGP